MKLSAKSIERDLKKINFDKVIESIDEYIERDDNPSLKLLKRNTEEIRQLGNDQIVSESYGSDTCTNIMHMANAIYHSVNKRGIQIFISKDVEPKLPKEKAIMVYPIDDRYNYHMAALHEVFYSDFSERRMREIFSYDRMWKLESTILAYAINAHEFKTIVPCPDDCWIIGNRVTVDIPITSTAASMAASIAEYAYEEKEIEESEIAELFTSLYDLYKRYDMLKVKYQCFDVVNEGVDAFRIEIRNVCEGYESSFTIRVSDDMLPDSPKNFVDRILRSKEYIKTRIDKILERDLFPTFEFPAISEIRYLLEFALKR